MANPRSMLLILALAFVVTRALVVVDATGANEGILRVLSASTRPTCQGSIDECMEDEDEFALDSEASRRILATKKYISYSALQKNNVPCSRRGASYYNCKPGAQANPYQRGCSKITRCRS